MQQIVRRKCAQMSESEVNMSSHERLVDWVQTGLHAGRYSPGQKLVETSLMKTLGISRGPVREGLKRLQGKGIVVIEQNRGASIRAYTRKGAADFLRVIEPLTRLMAQMAAEAVANGASSQDLVDMREWFTRLGKGELHASSFYDRRKHFYNVLMTLGGNEELKQIMPLEALHLLRLQTFPYLERSDREDIVNEYLAITVAVLNGNPESASQAALMHIEAAKKRQEHIASIAFPFDSDT